MDASKLWLDYSHLWIEIYRSPLAAALLSVIVWRAWVKKLSVSTLLNAVVVSYIVACFWPSNGIILTSQKLWFEGTPEAFAAGSPHLLSLVRSWHIEDTFISDRALTMAYIFYSIVLLPWEVWYKNIARFALVTLVITAFSACMLFVMVKYGLPNMLPDTNTVISSENIGPIVSQFRRSLEWYGKLPITCMADAMVAVVVSVASYSTLKNRDLPRSVIVMNVLCPIILLSFALMSLALLSPVKASLWIIFMGTLYVPVLAAIRTDVGGDVSLMTFYASGVRNLLQRR